MNYIITTVNDYFCAEDRRKDDPVCKPISPKCLKSGVSCGGDVEQSSILSIKESPILLGSGFQVKQHFLPGLNRINFIIFRVWGAKSDKLSRC